MHALFRYGAATLVSGIGCAIAWNTQGELDTVGILLLTVLASAWLGGLGPGLLATLVCTLGYNYFFQEPRLSLAVATVNDGLRLVLFAIVAIAISSLTRSRRAAQKAATAALGHARDLDALLDTVDETHRAHREFVADTSHELRNPLLALQTNIKLAGRIDDRETRDRCLSEAQDQVGRISRLVSDLLLLANVETRLVIEKRRVRLAIVAEKAIREAAQHPGGAVITLAASSPVEVMGDEIRLSQILSNLLDNAMKHTPASGTIQVGINNQGGMARLWVRDTGEGIAPEHLSRVLERGYRITPAGPEAEPGFGLGLTIVDYLARAHGGQVSIESQPGQGSCFTVSLPVAPAFSEAQSRSLARSE